MSDAGQAIKLQLNGTGDDWNKIIMDFQCLNIISLGSEVMWVSYFLDEYNWYSWWKWASGYKPVAIMLRITWSISLGYELNNLSLFYNSNETILR